MIQKVGFVGLGMMGLPMVENLAKTGKFTVWVCDRSTDRLEPLSKHPQWGHTLFGTTTLEDLAHCDAVITMLPNSSITNDVVRGSERQPGLASLLQPGSLVIDMGSSNPDDTLTLHQELAARDIELVDAPVSGAVAKARSGTLAIMVGGTPQACERSLALLQSIGSQVIRTGLPGSAHAMKALNNYVYATGLLATAEALLIAERMQLDLSVFADVLAASSGRNVAVDTKLRQFLIPRNYNGGFALALQSKDLATADALRRTTGIHAPQLKQCAELWATATASLASGADNTCIHQFLEQAADH